MSFEEQIMSKDKYTSIFLKSNGGYCVYYPSNIFRNTWGLFTNCLPSKTFPAYEVYFLLFSGTATSSRFVSSSVTKANRSPILTLILNVNLKP